MTAFYASQPSRSNGSLHETAQQLLETLARPARDVRLLKPEERRLAVTVLLAALVPADHKVRDIEIDRLMRLSSEAYKVHGNGLETIKNIAICKMFRSEELNSIALLALEILNIEDRSILVGMLWEIAICDNELHKLEEETIYAIAKRMDVPHKTTAEHHARAKIRL